MIKLGKKREYRKEDWIDPRIEIRTSPLQGKGMFAIKPIKEGEVVVIWGLKEWYSIQEEAEKAAVDGKIIDRLDDDLFALEDLNQRENYPSHYMNHSCDSNTWFDDEVTISARRDIEIGEELTIDYALMEGEDEFVSSWSIE